ncbi:hypothetical protein PUN28_000395 [Cardiocondyla obscurior]|uniref:Secreted protein n=1 Tax=Cardiocondyla obscurior TaxID=286306 RepID=A0AAW2GZA4_9HYME
MFPLISSFTRSSPSLCLVLTVCCDSSSMSVIFHPFNFCNTCFCCASSATVGLLSSRGRTSLGLLKWCNLTVHLFFQEEPRNK